MTRGVRNVPETVWQSIDVKGDDECWEWTRSTNKGYGIIRIDGRFRAAHRVAYETRVGSVPANLDLDHLCRNRGCCNPAHLEPVTRKENLARSPLTISAQRAAKTHCKRGHEYAGDNLLVTKAGGRECRTCIRDNRARRAA